MTKKYDIFLSYAKEDYKLAKNIYDDLSKNGASLWLDKIDLLPGQNWKIAIQQAIQESTYFLLLLSQNSVSKIGYVQKEQKIALEVLDEFPNGEIFIIPARLDECTPTDEKLKDIHWVDLYSSYEDGIGQILRVLKRQKLAETSSPDFKEETKDQMPSSEKEDNRKLTEFEAYYLAHAIKNRSFFIKMPSHKRFEIRILLYFLALDSVGNAHSTEINPYQMRSIGGKKATLKQKFELYSSIDLYVIIEFSKCIESKLNSINKCFDSAYIFVNDYGKEKLKAEYPDIFTQFAL